MLTFYNKYKGGGYSQNGEAGIIDECLRRMAKFSGVAIEFGAPTKQFCSNIYHLPESIMVGLGLGDLNKMGIWSKRYFDLNPQEPGIMKAEITPDNINIFIPSCQVLSMDTDGWDYELLKAWQGKCDILIIEINSSFAPTVEHYSKEQGASYRTMCKLLIEKGYFVICHTGNIIAVASQHRELFPEIPDDPVEGWSLFFNTKWLV